MPADQHAACRRAPCGMARGGRRRRRLPVATTHTLAANAVAQYRLAAAIMPDLHDIQYELGNALQEVSGGLRYPALSRCCGCCGRWRALVLVPRRCGCISPAQMWLHKSWADVGWLGSCGHVRAAAG